MKSLKSQHHTRLCESRKFLKNPYSTGSCTSTSHKGHCATYSEYELPTPEMDLPAGAAGPERLIVNDDTGEVFYTSSHYTEDFLNLDTGEFLPGEGEIMNGLDEAGNLLGSI